jgi:Tfp pilus assembly protein PilN
VKAVNLIPGDARRSSGVKVAGGLGPGYAVIGLLGVAVLLVSVYVLTSNTISDRQSKLATLQTEVTQEQAQVSRLTNFASFLKLTQTRVETVRQIASSRFDWHAALADLSNVMPANASLQSLTGTVAPGATVSGAGGSAGGSGSALRGAIASPAFEMQGCTKTQDDVARVMSRLRLINGVQRVTLASSVKQDSGATGTAVTSGAAASGSGASTGCGANAPTFDLVVFFAPLPGAGLAAATAAGATSPAPAAATAAGATSPAPAAAVATTAGSGTTPAAATTTPSTTTPSTTTPATTTPASAATSPGSQPVSTTAPATGGSK